MKQGRGIGLVVRGKTNINRKYYGFVIEMPLILENPCNILMINMKELINANSQ